MRHIFLSKHCLVVLAASLFSCSPSSPPFLSATQPPDGSSFCNQYTCKPLAPLMKEEGQNRITIREYTLSGTDAPRLTSSHFDFRSKDGSEEFSATLVWPGKEMRLSSSAQKTVDDFMNSAIGSSQGIDLSKSCITFEKAVEVYTSQGLSLSDQMFSIIGSDKKTYKVSCLLYANSPSPSMSFTISIANKL